MKSHADYILYKIFQFKDLHTVR